MKKKYVRNIACTLCNASVKFNALHPVWHYRSCCVICPCCGGNKLYDTVEYWQSTAVWYLPWTWFNGYWVNHVGVHRYDFGEQNEANK